MRTGSILTLMITLGLLGGCAQEPQRRTSIESPQWVGPFSEAEFDAFATRAAERLRVARAADGWSGGWIAPPEIVGDGSEPEDRTPAVAQRIAQGINDRLGPAACFAPNTHWPAELASRLELERDALNGTLRATLVIRDPAQPGEPLRYSFATERAGERETLAGSLPPREGG